MFADQPAVRVEVSRPRLVEGGSGVLRLRVVNVSNESLTCTLGMQGALTDAWQDTPTVLAPGRKADRGVTIKDLARGLFVVHVSVDVERSDGATARFVGQIDREVDALASGPAINNVHITGDAHVLSDVTFFQSPEHRLNQGEYEEVELAPSSADIGLSRVTIADRQGLKLHVITGDRIVIGRDPKSDLVFPDRVVSNVHVEITKAAGRFVVHQRSRTNTTVLNQSSVMEDLPAILPKGEDSTLVLSGTCRCRIRVIQGDGTAASVRRGLVERGMPVASSSADGIAGLLLTPDASGGQGFVPVLWLNTAMRVAEAGIDGLGDANIVLSAFCGLQGVQLADDGRVLSVSHLRVNAQLGRGCRVVDG